MCLQLFRLVKICYDKVVHFGLRRWKNRGSVPCRIRSGQLLDHYLEAIDLDRSKNIYIANIVKCRPPENRDPAPEESAACLPWLRMQFRLLRPKIVVCLGRIAAQQMIGKDFSVTRDHGKFFDKQGTLFMATLHPAALLRNPKSKISAFEDFVALREKIEQVCDHTYNRS